MCNFNCKVLIGKTLEEAEKIIDKSDHWLEDYDEEVIEVEEEGEITLTIENNIVVKAYCNCGVLNLFD